MDSPHRYKVPVKHSRKPKSDREQKPDRNPDSDSETVKRQEKQVKSRSKSKNPGEEKSSNKKSSKKSKRKTIEFDRESPEIKGGGENSEPDLDEFGKSIGI